LAQSELRAGGPLLASSAHHLAYRVSPSAYDTSDGWVDGWRFMERGRNVGFLSGDRIAFLERAATSEGAGELHVAEVGGEPVRLLRNVVEWKELPDGRILAVGHAAWAGAHNRLVVIDLVRGEARLIATGIGRFRLLGPDTVLGRLAVSASESYVPLRIPPRGE
jgi:hypothetical protein